MNKSFPLRASVFAIMLLSTVAYSQTGQLRGRVLLKSADAKEVPAANAQIDVFRVDLAGDYRTRTDQKGEFVFAGLPFVGIYLIAASAEGARPAVLANVKAGREIDFKLVLEPGDGKRFNREEATYAASLLNAKPELETADQTKARTFREGNNALIRRDYDQAIRIYEEGAAILPPEPNLLTNLTLALNSRAVERHNTAICCTRDAENGQKLIESAKSDLRKAAEVSARAVGLLGAKPADQDEAVRWERSRVFALKSRAEAMRLLVTLVDPSQATSALAAIQEYLDVEEDPNQRSSAELNVARMLLDSKNTNLALEKYRELLIQDPNNPEALAGFGFALIQSGNRDKAAEAAVYLERFLEIAPPSQTMRPAVTDALKKLKSHP